MDSTDPLIAVQEMTTIMQTVASFAPMAKPYKRLWNQIVREAKKGHGTTVVNTGRMSEKLGAIKALGFEVKTVCVDECRDPEHQLLSCVSWINAPRGRQSSSVDSKVALILQLTQQTNALKGLSTMMQGAKKLWKTVVRASMSGKETVPVYVGPPGSEGHMALSILKKAGFTVSSGDVEDHGRDDDHKYLFVVSWPGEEEEEEEGEGEESSKEEEQEEDGYEHDSETRDTEENLETSEEEEDNADPSDTRESTRKRQRSW